MRAFIKCHGGKWYLRHWISGFVPIKREVYIEPFLGGGSVLLSLFGPRVGCDKNVALIELWKALREGWLIPFVKGLSYSEDTFLTWKVLIPQNSQELAIRELVTRRMSRGGLGTSFAWSTRKRGGLPGDLNAWNTWVEGLGELQARVNGVGLRGEDFRVCIPRYDNPRAVIYCDPPYLHTTRTARAAYEEFEMSRKDHIELLNLVNESKATILISGYESPLYMEALAGWRRHKREMPCHAGQGGRKNRRVECLWVRDQHE